MKKLVEKLIKEEYQGWSNRMTWGVALIIDNNQGMYRAVKDEVGEIFARDKGDYDTAELTLQLEEFIKNYVDELVTPTLDRNENEMVPQLLNTALGEVDFLEIAKAHIEEEQTERGNTDIE